MNRAGIDSGDLNWIELVQEASDDKFGVCDAEH
jgi:hypothetical protein